ncbi:MAG TPA: Holliday junction branch migration protein RuvA [Bdellovibrionota bacterium]|nr:Holliday junction branch migration protein RuvA [Bdellovibrionota bacterium]
MIGWLKGTIKEKTGDSVVIDTGGVGYEVHVSVFTNAGLGPASSPVEVYVHTHVREDGITLYGFASPRERELFRVLILVSGVGAKTAMGILSALPLDRLVGAIRSGDIPTLQRTPGIGKKTAERLVVELRDRLKDFPLHADMHAPAPHGRGDVNDDVISALVNLGYKRPDAEMAVARIDLSKFGSFDRILKETLKLLTR